MVTNSDEIAKKVKKLREHGQSEKYYHETFGHNYRIEGIQGAVLGVKLKYLERWTNERRRAAAKYKAVLKGLDRIIIPKEGDEVKHVYHLYVIRINEKKKDKMKELRDK